MHAVLERIELKMISQIRQANGKFNVLHEAYIQAIQINHFVLKAHIRLKQVGLHVVPQ